MRRLPIAPAGAMDKNPKGPYSVYTGLLSMGMLTKILVFCHYGGPNWYFCYSWACCKTCVRVIYASFDPPLEIVSLGEIFQNL